MSARAYYRILRVARTAADLAGEEKIREEHLREAIGLPDGGQKILGEAADMMKEEKRNKVKYELWLAELRISSRKKCLLRQHMKTAENVLLYRRNRDFRNRVLNRNREKIQLDMHKRRRKPGEEYEKMCEKGIRFIPFFDGEYPGRLLELQDFPYALYVKGRLAGPGVKKRRQSSVREDVLLTEKKYAVEFGKILAGCGIEIISGLARGIDGMGQRGALMGGGRTFAVLGSGADVCYPREHIGLYVDILNQGGGILSEISAGYASSASEFPSQEPDHQRSLRNAVPCHGGKGKKRISHHRRPGSGAGERCLCTSGTGEQ